MSTLVAQTISNGSISTSTANVINGAKAWANYTGSTSTINGSYNVSSITRSSAGNYAISFTTAMANTGYAVVLGGANTTTNNNTATNVLSITTSGFSLQHIENGATVDWNPTCFAVFR